MRVKGTDLVKTKSYSLEPKRREEDDNLAPPWGGGELNRLLKAAKEGQSEEQVISKHKS